MSHVNETYKSDISIEDKSVLIKSIYEKKTITYRITRSMNKEDISYKYLKFQDNINYISSLLRNFNFYSNKNKVMLNFEFLTTNYKHICSQPNTDTKAIDWYLGEVKAYLFSRANPGFKVNFLRTLNKTYDYNLSVAYANTFYTNYNPNYPDWNEYGGDCANFISQCLRAGGKKYEGIPGKSDSSSFKYWFSKGNKTDTSMVSSTHRWANAFRLYWQNNSSSYKRFKRLFLDAYIYGDIGDVVSLIDDSTGLVYHTLLIIDNIQDEQDFIIAAHDEDTNSTRLSQKLYEDTSFIIYKM